MPGAPISLQTSPESANKDRSNYFKDTRKRNLLAFLLLTILIFIIFIGRGKGDPFVSLPSPFSEFVGREEILKEVSHFLLSSNQKGLSIVVLWGEGGIGKSETAIQFANQHLRKFSLIYWISAGSEELYQQSYFNLAQELNITVDKKIPFERLYEKVHLALENKKNRKPWLLIYDNADSVLMTPQRGNGKILVTTRDKTQWDFAKCMEITPFSEKNAEELYKKIIQKEQITQEWLFLAKELDYYPLALTQALHYIKESPHFSVADYRSSLKKNKNALFSHTGFLSRYPKNLLAIWQVSANTIRFKDPHAYAWLEICAHLHPDKIPIYWLETWLGFEKRATVESAKVEANEILRRLVNQGHIRLSQDRKYFSIHRLKQELIKLTQSHSDEVSCRVLSFLAHLVKDYEFMDSVEWNDSSWGFLLDWEASAAWGLSNNKQSLEKIEDQMLLLNVMGNIQTVMKGRCIEAIELFQRALEMYERYPDRNVSKSRLYSLLNQGQCYFIIGKCQQAIDRGNEALRLTLDVPTKERAHCLLYLGTFFNFHGKARKAVQCAEEALSIFQSFSDAESQVEICETIKVIGNFWRFFGDYEKAIQFCLQALELNRALFEKKENIQRSYIFINLGRAFRDIGEIDLALKCHLEAYRIEQKVFFSDIFLPILSLKEIALDYCAKGKYSQSLRYTQRAFQVAERMWHGKEQTRIQLIVNLGEIYINLHKIDKGIKYFNDALDKFHVLSKDGYRILYADIYKGLGRAYFEQGDVEKGIRFFEKALEFQEAYSLEMPGLLPKVIKDFAFYYHKHVDREKVFPYQYLLKEGPSLSIEKKQFFKKECLEAI